MKVSTKSLDSIKRSEVNYEEATWNLLQDNLLGTVSDIMPGDNLIVTQEEWDNMLVLLKASNNGDMKHKVIASRTIYKSAAISSNHDHDKNANQKFMLKLSQLLTDWLS
ncbi:hypothetical protein [Marinifilum caeruleilacunae]|uniref:Uncharacterized protein n=1 Tax=Marinifilum caeruleilacunae TaxID=2499076 RepID=A0ABX1WUD2_9BACT|nr:hypothetical protein [Marinifilum caeruleilacunae]NOU59710.1 hypothetical protein [Marinifilum caeruleilacunae]